MNKFVKKLIKKNKTALGVGPMSKNCVDATIELSNKYNIPIMLIASRRQIDSEFFGGGYVNKWSTKIFSEYVKKNDKKGNIILARDHGGPWQNSHELENKYNIKKAMQSAKKSFEEDILNDFKIIHIDTSIQPSGKKISTSKSLDRFYELFEHCLTFANKNKKEIEFEIGTEEQSGSTNTPDELEFTLQKVTTFCKKKKFKKPIFVVIQSGTKVSETRNIGSFESPLRIENELAVEIQLPKMIEICRKNNFFMKEHNADYLTDHSLTLHPKLGIHAANIAPEFGVGETKALIKILKENNLKKELDLFLEISFKSKKWKKWLIPGSNISDLEKSIISGHYVFSDYKFLLLKEKLKKIFIKKNINLDKYLRDNVKKLVYRYIKNFNLVR
tara:strand:+ start:1403 stop:2563 length:1161 start_codon:yes stop_codon:yes gene_type:complete